MSKLTSFRLTEKSQKDLIKLRKRPGGFNLSAFINQMIQREANK